MNHMFASNPPGTVLVQFRAGKCSFDGKRVTPDARKGKFVLLKSDDGLHHVQWYDRTKGLMEDDLIAIQDAYLEKVSKVTDGRVFVLRFTSSDKLFFLWMQEPDETKDAAAVETFNSAIGAKIPTSSPRNLIIDTFREAEARSGRDAASTNQKFVSFQEIFSADWISLLDDDDKAALMEQMPAGSDTSELIEALGSPQLEETMSHLTQATYSDQLGVLFVSLGLNMAFLSTESNPMTSFIKALEAKYSNMKK